MPGARAGLPPFGGRLGLTELAANSVLGGPPDLSLAEVVSTFPPSGLDRPAGSVVWYLDGGGEYNAYIKTGANDTAWTSILDLSRTLIDGDNDGWTFSLSGNATAIDVDIPSWAQAIEGWISADVSSLGCVGLGILPLAATTNTYYRIVEGYTTTSLLTARVKNTGLLLGATGEADRKQIDCFFRMDVATGLFRWCRSSYAAFSDGATDEVTRASFSLSLYKDTSTPISSIRLTDLTYGLPFRSGTKGRIWACR